MIEWSRYRPAAMGGDRFHVVGKALEPNEFYLGKAKPATGAGLTAGSKQIESPGTKTNYGLIELMTASRLHFDVVDPRAAWERYAIVQ